MKYLLATLFILTACSENDQESYSVLINPIKAGGAVINFDPDSTFTNIPEITESLSEREGEIFNKSLAWYGVESDFELERLHSKTARQLVNIVNCLKVTVNLPRFNGYF